MPHKVLRIVHADDFTLTDEHVILCMIYLCSLCENIKIIYSSGSVSNKKTQHIRINLSGFQVFNISYANANKRKAGIAKYNYS